MDLIAAKLGANMAIEALTASGQIGGEKRTSVEVPRVSSAMPDEIGSLDNVTADVTFAGAGCYFLNDKPKANKDEDYEMSIGSGENAWFFANNTNGGAVSKRVFSLGGNLKTVCPTFALNYPEYTNISYVYEDTSDNLGLAVTLPRGWYALNINTFAVTPFNFEDNPVAIQAFDELDISSGGENAEFVKENWFTLVKKLSFTIQEKNVCETTKAAFVGLGDVSRDTEETVFTSGCFYIFAIDNQLRHWGRATSLDYESVVVSRNTLQPIDPKYLPSVADLPEAWIADLKTALGIA